MIRRILLPSWILLITVVAGARENLQRDFNPSVILAKTAHWQAVRKLEDNKVNLQFIPVGAAAASGAEAATSYNPPVPSSFLRSARLSRFGQHDYLVTVWQEGVHTTVLRIYDPKDASGPLIWQKHSVGDVRFNRTTEGLTVTVNEIQPGEIKTRPVMVKWKAEK
ncbi:MAG: hypothetical protein AB7N80_09885 [Bdellovibrionales bacterium]